MLINLVNLKYEVPSHNFSYAGYYIHNTNVFCVCIIYIRICSLINIFGYFCEFEECFIYLYVNYEIDLLYCEKISRVINCMYISRQIVNIV